MRKFNTIKKSRKKSRDIDEKIEYLNNECQKTGLNEIMNTTDMYQGITKVPNQNFSDFEGKSQGGYGLGLSGADGNGAGGASVDVVDNTVVNCGSHIGLAGVAISPPHPVTGQRRCARTITNATGSGSPLRPGTMQGKSAPSGGALWFFDPNADGGLGRWRNFQWHTSQNAWGFWDTNFLGFFFLNTNLDQYVLSGVNIGTDIKNKIGDINFGTNGSIGEPQTTVLTKNDLGDSGFLPINIPDLSGEAYNYLKNKANNNIASGGVNYDLYNYLDKRYGIEASNWYENNPTLPHESNPFIPTPEAPYVPLASNPNEPVSDIDIPGPLAGAQEGDEIALFGGGNNKNTPPPAPTRRTRKGSTDATKASTGMYPSMTPEIFQQKYGISWSEYLKLP